MRKVYLTREKSFVGFIGKLSVLVEDRAAGNMLVNDTLCRRVGYVKNGETISFDIGEGATKIFVIADSLSKDYCNDYYPIPAGMDTVTISGKCTYNPTIGNPFRFNGVTNEEVLASRKKNGRKGLIVFIVAILLGIATGVLTNLTFPETFGTEDFEIRLTSAFSTSYDEDMMYIASNNSLVSVYKYSFSDNAELNDMTVAEAFEALRTDGMFAPESFMADIDGISVVEDIAESVSGTPSSYFTVFVKGDNALFLFKFGCDTDDYARLRSDFVEWAKTIKLK